MGDLRQRMRKVAKDPLLKAILEIGGGRGGGEEVRREEEKRKGKGRS